MHGDMGLPSKYGLPEGWRVVLGAPTPSPSLMTSYIHKFYNLVPAPAANFLYFHPLADRFKHIVLLGDYRDPLNNAIINESMRTETPLIHRDYAMKLSNIMLEERPFYHYKIDSDISSRITVVYGDKDAMTAPTVAEEMRKLAPYATIQGIANCGHLVHLEGIEELRSAVVGP
jgi:pimeloyl-ACP methyl ester carboxylesterase